MRLLHTMLRVGDLQRSIDFYTHAMGMQLLRTTKRPEQKYDLAFVGYASNPDQAPPTSSLCYSMIWATQTLVVSAAKSLRRTSTRLPLAGCGLQTTPRCLCARLHARPCLPARTRMRLVADG